MTDSTELTQPRMGTELTPPPRFELRRRIGEGSFGVVYEAYDHARQAKVAVKWLRYADADQVYRFKNEFRALAEISHPNLVQLFDFEHAYDQWFFTMELVRGVTLPEHFRPDRLPAGAETLRAASSQLLSRPGRGSDPGPASAPRALDVEPSEVRAVFGELAEGVVALHECGKLHRDLKCQNVLVTPDRRVVLLDFGMVRELRRDTEAHDVAGTPLYMAPELIGSGSAGPPSDWYSFGVMLYRALTDELPFDGRMYAVLARKQSEDAPRVSDRVSDVPEDLVSLTARLLSRDPAARPSGMEVLEALGGGRARPRISYPSPAESDVFVGRRRELRLLEAARRRIRDGAPMPVFVHGPSGIGKSALVRHFLERLSESDTRALVLRGRCFERETLPYKALDEVVDALIDYLLALPTPVVEDLVPTQAPDLARVFPGLMRVPAFANAAGPLSEVPDPQEQRRRAVEGLEDLLRRLTAVRDVVISIDDLHWGDRDSALMIRPLLGNPGAPPILWVGTYRTEADASPFLSAMREVPDWETFLVQVGELGEEAARTLLELRLSGTARDEELLDELAREAAGSPLLIDLLVRHVRDGEDRSATDLHTVLRKRIGALPPEAHRLLDLLAVHGSPLQASIAARVLGVEALDAKLLTQLRNAKLLRLSDDGRETELELYHDRIREAVAGGIAGADEAALHAALGEALGALEERDPEALAMHFRGAGQHAKAFHYTLEAAAQAEAALAFERVAELLTTAIELRPRAVLEGAEAARTERSLWGALGEALRNAGRGAEAARAFLEASRRAGGRERLELQREAAEQFLFSGHLDEGRTLMRDVLEEIGLSMPESPVRVIAEFLARRAQVRLRGTRFRERPATELGDAERFRIDACWSVAVGLAMIDPVRGGIFQARHMLMALEAGELGRVARAVAVEVPFAATAGAGNDRRTAELERLGQELAAREGSAYIRGLLASSTGGARWLCGRWAEALRYEEQALEVLRTECAGVAWQITSSTVVLLDALFRMGHWAELFRHWPDELEDASVRGDRLLEIYVRIKFAALSHLAAGRPDDAIRESQDALARWSQSGFQLLHLWDLHMRVEALLYAGRVDAAYDRLEAGRPAVRRSGLLQLQMYDITFRDLEGRVALAGAARAHGRRRAARLKEVAAAIKSLKGTRADWARGPAALLEAGVASVEARERPALRALERAERAFETADMSLHARIARARAAERRGELGRLDDELEALGALGLAEPDRWLDVLAPGSFQR